MPITQITPYTNLRTNIKFKKNNNQQQNNNIENTLQTQKFAALPSTHQYLSFKGGTSLSLAKNIELLGDLVPARVLKAAAAAIKECGENAESLLAIHKKVYEPLKYVETLDEAKALFPEFEEVVPAMGFNWKSDSFIAKAKRGENKFFAPNDDVSLEILKMYWADGFTLGSISRIIGQGNIQLFMKKVGIQNFSQSYAKRIKLSDPDYNERFTSEMGRRVTEAYDKRNPELSVPIPRGPMSRETKAKISEKLRIYWANNPDRAFNMSLSHEAFLIKNPELAAKFRDVMIETWGADSCKPVRQAISSFFAAEKKIIPSNTELSEVLDLSLKNKNLLRKFWATHPDMKDKFSEAMKWAWKRVEMYGANPRENSEFYPIMPSKMKKVILNWANKEGYDTENIDFCAIRPKSGIRKKDMYRDYASSGIWTRCFKQNKEYMEIYGECLMNTILSLLQKYNEVMKGLKTQKMVAHIFGEAKTLKKSLDEQLIERLMVDFKELPDTKKPTTVELLQHIYGNILTTHLKFIEQNKTNPKNNAIMQNRLQFLFDSLENSLEKTFADRAQAGKPVPFTFLEA